MELKNSETEQNLMRAFAGESQARNRYTFAGEIANNQKNQIIYLLFKYVASQEEAHAKVFIDHLKAAGITNVDITAGYPVDMGEDLASLLKQSNHNELEEHDNIYKTFADVATKEGFTSVANSFTKIAEIEKHHADLFDEYSQKVKDGMLFKSTQPEKWICTHCGYIYEGIEAPKVCPVCQKPQSYYSLLSKSNFE